MYFLTFKEIRICFSYGTRFPVYSMNNLRKEE